jgi:hypothetical protein
MGPPGGNGYIRQISYGREQQQQPLPDTAYRGVQGNGGYGGVAQDYDGDREGDMVEEYGAGAYQPGRDDEEAQEEEPGPGVSYDEYQYTSGRQMVGDGDEYEYGRGPGGYYARDDEDDQAGGPIGDDEDDRGPGQYYAPNDDEEAVDEGTGNRQWYRW